MTFKKWNEDQLVMDKWFALQASSFHPNVLGHVKELLNHKDFDSLNPNRVRSVLRQFARAILRVSIISVVSYKLVADYALKLDDKNSK